MAGKSRLSHDHLRRAVSPHPESRRASDPVSTAAELEFRQALEEYKRQSHRLFPTWSEVLGVARSLGYAKGHDTATAD